MSPREQRRLLLLVLLLGLVLWMMVQVRRPQMWHWMKGGDATPPVGGTSPAENPGKPALQEALPADNRALPFDEQGAADRVFRSVGRRGTGPGSPTQESNWRIRPELLQPIRDNAPFREAEHAAWFAMWERLRDARPEDLTKAAERQVSYGQLDRQPEIWRGRLVTLEGVFHRAMPARAPANQHGIGRYYEVWLEPAEAPALPVVIHCLELPPGFPQGMQIRVEGRATGFFFKRWLYDSTDGLRTAPLVVARSVEVPSAAAANRRPSPREAILLLVVSMLLGLGAAAWLYFRVAPRRTVSAGHRRPERIELPTHEVE